MALDQARERVRQLGMVEVHRASVEAVKRQQRWEQEGMALGSAGRVVGMVVVAARMAVEAWVEVKAGMAVEARVAMAAQMAAMAAHTNVQGRVVTETGMELETVAGSSAAKVMSAMLCALSKQDRNRCLLDRGSGQGWRLVRRSQGRSKCTRLGF